MTQSLDALRRASAINGVNAEYIDQLYEAFKEAPGSVSPEWRHYFYGFELASQGSTPGGERSISPTITGARPNPATEAERLVMAYRMLGHLMADDGERTRYVGDGLEIAGSFDWDLCAKRYMYVFQMAHAYKDRTMDFTTGDPRPPTEAVP